MADGQFETVVPIDWITLDAAKQYVNVTHDEDDDLLEGLLRSSLIAAEREVGFELAPATKSYSPPNPDAEVPAEIAFPLETNYPEEVSSTHFDPTSGLPVVDSDWVVTYLVENRRVLFTRDAAIPTEDPSRWSISWTVAANTKDRDKVSLARLMMVADWYQDREAKDPSPGARAQLAPLRRARV